MSLQLFELVPATPSREAAQTLIVQVSQAVEAAGASVLESQVTASHERIFTIVEPASDDVAGLTAAVRGAASDAEVTGPDEVRLVGAQIEDVRALARKKISSPKYAQVPEVSFLRTYVLRTRSSACASTTPPMKRPWCAPARPSPPRSTASTPWRTEVPINRCGGRHPALRLVPASFLVPDDAGASLLTAPAAARSQRSQRLALREAATAVTARITRATAGVATAHGARSI